MKKSSGLLVFVCLALIVAYFFGGHQQRPVAPVLSAEERQALRDAPGDDFDASADVGRMRSNQTGANIRGVPVPTAAAPAVGASDCGPDVTPFSAPDVSAKINGRNYPSVFQAWQPASNTGSMNHDLIWNSPTWKEFGLKCFSTDSTGKLNRQAYPGLCTTYAGSLPKSDNVVRLAEIRWHDGWFSETQPGRQYFPKQFPGWMNGMPSVAANTTMKDPSFRLNYQNACFQNMVAQQCQAAVKAGLDGCMFDWWSNPDESQVNMLKKVRAAIGDALIIVNANGNIPSDLSDVNGVFAEGFGTEFFSHRGGGGAGGNGSQVPYPQPQAWQYLIDDLKKLKGAKKPQINAIEGWGEEGDSRYMRALTTLVLVYSNAYVLYSRSNGENGLPDHTHVWDDFWTQDLGQPTDQDPPDAPPTIPGGAVYRRFSKGIAVYNPTAAAVTVPASLLDGLHRSHRNDAALKPGADAQVPPGDGDIFVQ
jgi:hypothetical protein